MIKFWELINGKKMYIGIFVKGILTAIGQQKPELLPIVEQVMMYVDLWILGAAGHKLAKIKS